jgi:hypothetical protein
MNTSNEIEFFKAVTETQNNFVDNLFESGKIAPND